jgi:hypothetical protein
MKTLSFNHRGVQVTRMREAYGVEPEFVDIADPNAPTEDVLLELCDRDKAWIRRRPEISEWRETTSFPPTPRAKAVDRLLVVGADPSTCRHGFRSYSWRRDKDFVSGHTCVDCGSDFGARMLCRFSDDGRVFCLDVCHRNGGFCERHRALAKERREIETSLRRIGHIHGHTAALIRDWRRIRSAIIGGAPTVAEAARISGLSYDRARAVLRYPKGFPSCPVGRGHDNRAWVNASSHYADLISRYLGMRDRHAAQNRERRDWQRIRVAVLNGAHNVAAISRSTGISYSRVRRTLMCPKGFRPWPPTKEDQARWREDSEYYYLVVCRYAAMLGVSSRMSSDRVLA